LTYTYVLRNSDGTTFTVSGINQDPASYAQILAGTGLTIVSSQAEGTAYTYTVYRLILETSPGRVDTGATYPGCLPRGTASDVALCDPQQFASTADAFAYAAAHNEIPVIVASAEAGYVIAEAEERARQLQQQYTGPSASPAPQPGQGGPVPPPVPVGFNLESYAPFILGGLAIWFLAKR